MIKIRISGSDILFENEHYIAINKKAGWVVHQTLDPNRSNLFDALKSFIKQRDKLESSPYLTLHHRLDIDTSGIMIFGKTKDSNKVLADIFNNRLAKKIYHAICYYEGKDLMPEGLCEDFLKKEKHGKIEKMIRVKAGGQKTLTKYRILEENNHLKLIEFELVTGRMHQIRVQSALRGFPIVGDTLYGDNNINKKHHKNGQLLHATSFEFFDTLSKKTIKIDSKTPFLLNDIGSKKENRYTYVLFNKPYNVLCQFTKDNDLELALCDFNLPKEVYPVGRLDKDSEGLLLLTNDNDLKNKIASPKYNIDKTYLVQIENIPTSESLKILSRGIVIKDNYKTLPCIVRMIKDVDIPERRPPIRVRKKIPTCWLEIKIREGKNRQVRRMTAAIGHPTLRLIRVAIGDIKLEKSLLPGSHLSRFGPFTL